MAEYAVELRNVWKRFPGPGNEVVTAVKDVSLKIADGEFFALLGPSGCGKTTSLRMIAGFELPSEGEIFLHGRPMGKTPPYQRSINTVFQSYALFPHMTIGENIAFGLQMKKIDKQETQRRVGEALEMVRLPHVENRKPSELSGGQQQMLAVARALVADNKLLLIDEPSEGLAPLMVQKIGDLIEALRKVGTTIVLAEQNLHFCLGLADRAVVIDKGADVFVGTIRELNANDDIKQRYLSV